MPHGVVLQVSLTHQPGKHSGTPPLLIALVPRCPVHWPNHWRDLLGSQPSNLGTGQHWSLVRSFSEHQNAAPCGVGDCQRGIWTQGNQISLPGSKFHHHTNLRRALLGLNRVCPLCPVLSLLFSHPIGQSLRAPTSFVWVRLGRATKRESKCRTETVGLRLSAPFASDPAVLASKHPGQVRLCSGITLRP